MIATIKNIIVYVTNILSFGGLIMDLADRINSWMHHGESLKLECRYRQQVEGLGMKPNNIHLTWRITNLSQQATYIKAVGFRQNQYSFADDAIYSNPSIYLTKPQAFPIKLESRDTIEFSLADGNQMEEARYLKYMYVETKTGYSKAVKLPFPHDEVFSRPRQEYRLPR